MISKQASMMTKAEKPKKSSTLLVAQRKSTDQIDKGKLVSLYSCVNSSNWWFILCFILVYIAYIIYITRVFFVLLHVPDSFELVY